VAFCSSFRLARVREDLAARVPPVVRGSARLIRATPPRPAFGFPIVPVIRRPLITAVRFTVVNRFSALVTAPRCALLLRLDLIV
jgi:hypothetical protein